ncbi:hypothetical protein chiPu_0027335, partial [Chiloscyllium punctatum]|nr:hypothetical protein [Chiloscyllium punctatum]
MTPSGGGVSTIEHAAGEVCYRHGRPGGVVSVRAGQGRRFMIG